MLGNLYIITNSINDLVYIGKTTLSIEDRFKQHKRESSKHSTRPLYTAFNTLGVENFTVLLIEKFPLDELDSKEIEYINLYDSYRSGYNATLGGEGKAIVDRASVFESFYSTHSCAETARTLKIDKDTVSSILKAANISIDRIELSRRRANSLRINELDLTFNDRTECAMYLIYSGIAKTTNLKTVVTGISRAASGSRNSYLKLTFQYMPS
jgi:hypothetical protein